MYYIFLLVFTVIIYLVEEIKYVKIALEKVHTLNGYFKKVKRLSQACHGLGLGFRDKQ